MVLLFCGNNFGDISVNGFRKRRIFGFFPGNEDSTSHFRFDGGGPDLRFGFSVERPGLGRISLFPNPNLPLIWTPFSDISHCLLHKGQKVFLTYWSRIGAKINFKGGIISDIGSGIGGDGGIRTPDRLIVILLARIFPRFDPD
jgi:hypothetical protein